MADFPAPAPVPDSGVAAGQPPVSAGLLAYALFGTAAVIALVSSGFPLIAPLMGFVGIAGLIVAYVKRDDARGTWIASHLTWLIRTFWYSLLWGAIGGTCVRSASPHRAHRLRSSIWVVASIWVIYRVVRGYLLFKESKPIPGF